MLIDILLTLGRLSLVRYKSLTGKDGSTSGPFIVIDPKYKRDIPLLMHERTHAGQFWLAATVWFAVFGGAYWLTGHIVAALLIIPGGGAHQILQKLLPAYHRYVVITAHRAQLRYSDNPFDDAEFFAHHIAHHYNTGLTYSEALKKIIKGL